MSEFTTWEDYAAFTDTVSIYPNAGTASHAAQEYALLGLFNEAGELAGKVKKLLRDGAGDMKTYEPKGVPFIPAALDELGDVLFYAIRCIIEMHEIDSRQEALAVMVEPTRPRTTTRWGTSAMVSHTVKLASAVGEYVQRQVLLAVPDDEDFDDEHPVLTDHPLPRVFEGLQVIATVLGSNLEAVAALNETKLSSRQERGVIQGDGDNR